MKGYSENNCSSTGFSTIMSIVAIIAGVICVMLAVFFLSNPLVWLQGSLLVLVGVVVSLYLFSSPSRRTRRELLEQCMPPGESVLLQENEKFCPSCGELNTCNNATCCFCNIPLKMTPA